MRVLMSAIGTKRPVFQSAVPQFCTVPSDASFRLISIKDRPVPADDVEKPRNVQLIRLGSRLVCVCIILTTIWVSENAVTADIARTCAVCQ